MGAYVIQLNCVYFLTEVLVVVENQIEMTGIVTGIIALEEIGKPIYL